MDLETYKAELAEFLDREVDFRIRRQFALDEGLGPEGRAFARRLGEAGLLGMGLPREYGGGGGGIEHDLALVNAFADREAMVPNVVARLMCGPTLLQHGSDTLKAEFVPRIANGEIEFALGYTEPQAGSDLSAIDMQAEDAGDHWVISGQKLYQTESHYADYHWLAVRTEPETKGHRGISLLIVDQQAPGIEILEMKTLGRERTNTVFYDGVLVPKSRLVGEPGRGFYYMMEALDHERVLMLQTGRIRPYLDRIVHAAGPDPDAARRVALAEMSARLSAAQSIEKICQSRLARREPMEHFASIFKVFTTELRQDLSYLALDVIGSETRIERDQPTAPLGGEPAFIARAAVVDTIGAGSSEVLRNAIASRGLNLPRGA